MGTGNLAESLRQALKWLERYEPQGKAIGEENTKVGLIAPILEGLGWDIHDPDEVHHEFRRKPNDNPVDYALMLQRIPKVLVEAKGVGEHLEDHKWLTQTLTYATAAVVEWVVLTNGAEWRIYNAYAQVPPEQKLFRVVKLHDGADEATSVLQLLSKDNMSENRIAELWRAYFVDQRVQEALQGLFSLGDPARELISAVHRRTKDLSLKDIRTSLTRVRATFEFPTVASSVPQYAAPMTTAGPMARGNGSVAPSSTYQHVSAAERKLSLLDLVVKGLLFPGQEIEAPVPHGPTVTAKVTAEGLIDFAGTTYKTPSEAGAAVKEQLASHPLTASEKATDGWRLWKTKSPTGSHVSLKELRRRLAQAQ